MCGRKYRAWDKINKEWYFRDMRINKEGCPFDVAGNSLLGEVEINEYIGFEDKNKKEICKCDILLIPDSYTERILNDGSRLQGTFNQIAEVKYDEKRGCYGVDIRYRSDFFDIQFYSFQDILLITHIRELEIIGNKYENSNLLDKS